MRLANWTLYFAILAYVASFANGQCCGKSIAHGAFDLFLGNSAPGQCQDGTWGTPCCGVGSCNLWCCGCRRGCRGRRKRDVDSDGFQLIDENKDGKVSLQEAIEGAVSGMSRRFSSKGINVKREFRKLDTNRDGFLDKDEIGA